MGLDWLDQSIFIQRLDDRVLVPTITTLQCALRFAAAGAGRGRRVQRLRGQHLRRAVDEVHGLEWRAVESEQVQTRHIVEGVRDHFVTLHCFRLVVSYIDRLVVLAGRGGELAPVDAERRHHDRAVTGERVGAVLPLHY